MQAGKWLFGERGFHAINIHEITDAANLSVGTFYKHFDSKESFFREQISSAGHEIRRFIAVNLRLGLNRLEVEMQGMFLFDCIYRWTTAVTTSRAREKSYRRLRYRIYYSAFRRASIKWAPTASIPRPSRADPAYVDSAIEFSWAYPTITAWKRPLTNPRITLGNRGGRRDCLMRGVAEHR
jgi:AcrR family transcriptional regulator